MTLIAAYLQHWWRTITFRHSLAGLPKSAGPTFWALFAVYYVASFMRHAAPPETLGWTVFLPIGDYCVAWLFFPSPVLFLWMFASITIDVISIFASSVGVFDPQSGAPRFILFMVEVLYGVFYTVRYVKLKPTR
jgi:hypothetical protein